MSIAAPAASAGAANAARVLEARYLRRDARRQIVESAPELFEHFEHASRCDRDCAA